MVEILLGNLLAWGLQVAAIAALGLVLPLALRLTSPGARLVYLRTLLLVCLVLPLVQPWVPVVLSAGPPIEFADALTAAPSADGNAATVVPPLPLRAPIYRRWPFGVVLAIVYFCGLAARLAWTGLGLLSLARLRRTSTRLEPRPESVDAAALLVGQDADFRVSERVVRPATFGLRRPVVLVPPDYLTFRPCSRRPWLRTSCCTCVGTIGYAPWLTDSCCLCSGSIRCCGGSSSRFT